MNRIRFAQPALAAAAASAGLVMAIHAPALAAGAAPGAAAAAASEPTASLQSAASLAPNASGLALTISTASASGRVDTSGPFFQSLGTNGRSCSSCHVQADGWTITPAGVQRRYAASGGTDPIFRLNDGAVSPRADVSTPQARRRAYAMLLGKGLIRVGMPIPPGAEFELAAVDDPYGHASAAELSLFRRPLPATNLKFLNTVMWDGRETFKDANGSDCIAGTTTCFAPLHFDLTDQARAATLGHAQAASEPGPEVLEAIVGFETSLVTAQVFDWRAGWLGSGGAHGGPQALALEKPYFGINDTLAGDYRTGAAFDPLAMTLYNAWGAGRARPAFASDAQYAVARGQALFNGKPFVVRGVGGLNDDLGRSAIAATCTTCHNSPNGGNHSVPMPLNVGTVDASRRTPDLPLYTLRNKATGETVQVSDPGRALVSGKWKDIGRFKGPTLRALATRAPYFHNGMAADLAAVVDFYDARFDIGFTRQEKADLVAFLRSL